MKKLIMCLLMSVLLIGITDLKAYAKEELLEDSQVVTINEEEIEETSDNKDKEDELTIQITSKNSEDLLNNESTTETESVKAEKEATKSTPEKKTYTEEDLKLLACLVHAEAGNQSYKGKLAVANVILNRVKSNLFPNTMKSVIYDKKWAVQFSVTVNGSLSKELKNYTNFTSKSQKESIKAAKDALEGTNNIGNYLYFTRYTKSLANSKKDHMKIGAHIFY